MQLIAVCGKRKPTALKLVNHILTVGIRNFLLRTCQRGKTGNIKSSFGVIVVVGSLPKTKPVRQNSVRIASHENLSGSRTSKSPGNITIDVFISCNLSRPWN